MMTPLQRETATYQAALPQMLSEHEGEYVVIKGSDLRHFSQSYESALSWAYETFGLESFLVKKVDSDQTVSHFTRDLGPCRS